jgi:alditol oxidase
MTRAAPPWGGDPPGQPRLARMTNWAGNVSFAASQLHKPAGIAELQRLVAGSRRIRALGTGHSFSPLVETSGDLVSVARLPMLVEADRAAGAVTVSAGLRYGQLAAILNTAGLALANMASLPHISVGGAVATGTHGSGDAIGCLSTAVTAIELVTAGGDLVQFHRDDDPAAFAGLVVALGAWGIVTRLTLQTVPAFLIGQFVYLELPYEQVAARFDQVTASGYSVSMFTDWRAQRMTQTWLKRLADRSDPPPHYWMGGVRADRQLNPVPGLAANGCTTQLGLPGPWHERLPHFRPDFMPSAGAELQSEYLIGREHAIAALAALDGIRALLAPVTQISEIRTVAADDLWLSPCYQRDCVAYHFTWLPDLRAVMPVIEQVEAALAPFAARPHWGKLFAMDPAELAARYPRLDDFRAKIGHLDPAGKFRNELIDTYLPPL